jgi:hypothetical protein
MIPASAAKELNYHGFFTIEQLAEAPDAAKAKDRHVVTVLRQGSEVG